MRDAVGQDLGLDQGQNLDQGRVCRRCLQDMIMSKINF